MWFGAWKTRTKLAFFPGFGAASGATNRQSLFFLDLHGYTMRRVRRTRWSIVTSLRAVATRIIISVGTAHEFEIDEEKLALAFPSKFFFRAIMFKTSAIPTNAFSPLSLSQLEGPNPERSELTPKIEPPYRPYTEVPAPSTPAYKPYSDEPEPEVPYEPYKGL
jgi:hypothetical protein